LLFVGGDFKRKGGPLLRECYRHHFARRCDLHVVTQSLVESEPGVFVHRGLESGSPAWRQLWEQADLFVFPSSLETFGIALVEALAFGVPVVSADVGAARFILADGEAGVLLRQPDELGLAAGIKAALENPPLTEARIQRGQARVKQHFDLAANAGRLAQWLHQAAGQGVGQAAPVGAKPLGPDRPAPAAQARVVAKPKPSCLSSIAPPQRGCRGGRLTKELVWGAEGRKGGLLF
jgi:hypothetical protein